MDKVKKTRIRMASREKWGLELGRNLKLKKK